MKKKEIYLHRLFYASDEKYILSYVVLKSQCASTIEPNLYQMMLQANNPSIDLEGVSVGDNNSGVYIFFTFKIMKIYNA